ncbi:MAG: hypothetical protein AAB436_00105 [Patescibacteria group bacterium]
MLAFEFFSWWYGRGWKQAASNFKPRLTSIVNSFSVGQLLSTLFEPWRRIISYPGASIDERFRAWGDNVLSRIIGFVVRMTVLFAALLIVSLTAVLSMIELILWPLLPIAVPALIIAGLVI